jgi:transposase-like protein
MPEADHPTCYTAAMAKKITLEMLAAQLTRMDAEADRLCNAQRYERTEARRDTRAGHYERNLETKAGEVTLKVPKLGGRPSRRRSSSAIGDGRHRSRRR